MSGRLFSVAPSDVSPRGLENRRARRLQLQVASSGRLLVPSRRTASSSLGLGPRALRMGGATWARDTGQLSETPAWLAGLTTTSGTWVSSALPLPWSTSLAFGAA